MARTHALTQPRSQWDIKYLPSPLDAINSRVTDDAFIPQNAKARRQTYATINAAMSAAFLRATGQMEFPDFEAYCAQPVQDLYVSEVFTFASQESTIVSYNARSGELRGVKVALPSGATMNIPTLSSAKDVPFADMVALYLPMMCYLLETGTETDFTTAVGQFDITSAVNIQNLHKLSTWMYYAIQDGTIRISDLAAGNIDQISSRKLQMGTLNGGNVFFGKAHVLDGGTGGQVRKSVTVGEAKSEFAGYTSTLNWTPEEELLIPEFADDFPVPEETLKIARRFVMTRGDKRPMVQFMWRGPTSIGKSTGVECLAAILHMPLLRMTCHPNMETADFLADFVPDTNGMGNAELPTFDQMEFDPVGSYEMLTGQEDMSATSQMCLEAYGKAMAAQSNTPRFKFVESNYVKALERGYIVEIQEASRIRNAGVMVGLNEFDRPGSVIPLLNGSYRCRHENAIVVVTDNVGYASCRPIDPSVLRRMAVIIDSDSLPENKLFERVKYNTGCDDTALLKKMYEVFQAVLAYCEEKDLMDEGSVSPTEFEMWVRCVMLDGEDALAETARECVVNKATSEPARQEEIMSAVVSPRVG